MRQRGIAAYILLSFEERMYTNHYNKVYFRTFSSVVYTLYHKVTQTDFFLYKTKQTYKNIPIIRKVKFKFMTTNQIQSDH